MNQTGVVMMVDIEGTEAIQSGGGNDAGRSSCNSSSSGHGVAIAMMVTMMMAVAVAIAGGRWG